MTDRESIMILVLREISKKDEYNRVTRERQYLRPYYSDVDVARAIARALVSEKACA